MLKKDDKERLEGLGFNVSALESAIKDEKEVAITIPPVKTEKDIEGYLSPDEAKTLGDNKFKEGQTAKEEILAKDLHDELGLDLPDGKEGRKNLRKIVEAYADGKVKESGKGEAAETISKLRATIAEQEETIKSKDLELSNKDFNFGVKGSVRNSIPEDIRIGKDDFETIFNATHRAVKEDGSTVWYRGDEKLVDAKTLAPLKTSDVVSSFIDERGYRKKSGKEGDDEDSSGGSHSGKFKSTSEFLAYSKKTKGEEGQRWAMSAEGQKFLKENKAEDFSYD